MSFSIEGGRTAIALGSNLGNSQTILETALNTLDRTPGIEILSRSSWYRTTPVGPPQPDYLNGCAILQVQLSPQLLLSTLLKVEQQLGRVRAERWGARTIDLDLLLYDSLILKIPGLEIPHPHLWERAFVLVPLAEIAANWIEPVTGKQIAELLKELDCSGVKHYLS